MKTFRDSLNEQLQNPEFRAEWKTLEPERQLIRAILDGKPLTGYTVEQIAEAAEVRLAEARAMQERSQANAEDIHREKMSQ